MPECQVNEFIARRSGNGFSCLFFAVQLTVPIISPKRKKKIFLPVWRLFMEHNLHTAEQIDFMDAVGELVFLRVLRQGSPCL